MALVAINSCVSNDSVEDIWGEEEEAQLYVSSIRRTVDAMIADCSEVKCCEPHTSPEARVNELLSSIDKLKHNVQQLLFKAAPIAVDLAAICVTGAYNDISKLITFFTRHIKTVAEMLPTIKETCESLCEVFDQLKLLIVEAVIKRKIDDLKKLVKEFLITYRREISTIVGSLITASTATTARAAITSAASFMGQRALLTAAVGGTVALGAAATVSVGSIIYKEVKRRKMLAYNAMEHCRGVRAIRETIEASAQEMLSRARKYEDEGKTEVALIYLRGKMYLEKVENNLQRFRCKCFTAVVPLSQ